LAKQKRQPSPQRTRRREQRPVSPFGSFARLDRSAVLFLILVFCLVHWAVRVFTSPVFAFEEAQQLLMSQSLHLGYDARHGPLLAWLHALAAMGLGVSTPVMFGIKYALMFVALAFYYLAARNVLTRADVSAGALAAWALTFTVGWAAHEDQLGGVALMAALSLTLHAATRILTWRRPRDWIYLGLAIGLGLLTHHLFILFPLTLLLAARVNGFFADAMKSGGLVIAIVVALLVYSPYAFWLATHWTSLASALQDYAASWEMNADWLARMQLGALSFAITLGAAVMPLAFFWAILFWRLWLPILYPVFARRSTDEEPHETAWRQLFGVTIIGAALVALTGVVFGVERYRIAWMLPVMFVAPLWMFAHVKRAGEFPVAIRAFAGIALFSMVSVIGGRIVESRFEIEMCRENGCRPYAPMEPWASALRELGFQRGTIVGDDPHLTGNLRAQFPRNRVMDASLAPFAFPPPRGDGACLAVWRDTPIMPEDLATYLTDRLGATPHDLGPETAIRRTFRLSETKAATLYLQFVPPSDACR
jgi:hypothetical protein